MIKNRSAPSSTVVPILIYSDLPKAIDWLRGAYDFKERLRAEYNGETGHAQLTVNDGAIMLGKAGGPYHPPGVEPVSQYVLIAVRDVDEHYDHAKDFGAEIMQGPANMPFGERQYTSKDLEGHWWTFSQPIADVAPEDWGAIVANGS